MNSAASSTIGELFLTLREMGFTEEQIQAAVQAGHFSVLEATEWLLQGQYPRHTLVNKSPQQAETAFSAFNPPKEAAHSTDPSLVLRPPQPYSPSSDPLPVVSRIKHDNSNFEEQERQRVAQEARAEKKHKQRERELVLKRIADDRRSLQEKNQSRAITETSPTSEGQKLEGKMERNVDNNCILMIRLPSGESLRERFAADAPLQTVVEHISDRHPSLPAFTLLQGFPRKRFGEAELTCSLRSLGLTPNAALCIQITPPETPQDPQRPADQPPVGQNDHASSGASPQPHVPVQEVAGRQDFFVPPPLPDQIFSPAAVYEGLPSPSGHSHFWGQGQRLVSGDAEEAPDLEDNEEGEPPPILHGMPRLPFFPENRMHGRFEPRHQWPEQGNRLREGPVEDQAEPEDVRGREAPAVAGLAAVERLQRAAQPEYLIASQEQPSPSKRPFRTPSVPSLRALATQGTVHLMMVPSMQYSSSLACLTPELAELLLNHMIRERLLRPRILEFFFGCPLQKFVLNCYPYSTNELLRQLRAFTALKYLSLVHSPLITDFGLSVLSNLVKLQHLNLASCSKLTDSCLQHVTGLRNLSFLSLDQTKVTDAGMMLYLQSAPSSLTQLSLNQTAVTEATLAVLPTCVPQLWLLSIKHTMITDVSALSELTNLQTLYLDGTEVTEVSLEKLATHPALSSLSLAGIPVVDGNHALQIISDLKLTQLTLPGRHCVTDSGLSFLSRLSLLSELDLKDYTQVTNQGVSQLSSLIRLKKLSLSNTQVTDAGLPPLRGLQELEELCLDRTAVTSRGAAELIVCLPHLQVLGLASTQVGDNIVRNGLIHCKQLVKLNLSRTRITDNGLKFLKNIRLAQVNLDGTGVSQTGIASLLSLANIGSVRASNTRRIAPDDVSDEECEAQSQ
ncbi:uncharacterized protein si:ch73-173p19.1 isoform X1 [Thalassophryne amazonica]|uniref:uncharacterized protein si:ch73-173p19.1 isoform X1 n=1 Tax=Thalassophryne amazonica TaxID=390379 RepID=UPI0014724D96|nr:uncharacterized protein si:ch73-173p19.1 isoform X1 [Thalassophryne amazonica]